MRFIHTSDWHLGRRLHEVDLHEEHAAFLDWLIELAVAREVDAVVVAGDVYDRAIPPVQSVQLLTSALGAFARAGIPLIVSSGNHDSAIRLGYAAEVLAAAGVHVRTDPAAVAEPIVLQDAHGEVGVYAIPFLHPQLQAARFEAEPTHQAVLGAATQAIRADAEERGLTRTIVLSHAFITSASPSDSERSIEVGGIGDVAGSVFSGFSYVALGHLHGAQQLSAGDDATVLRYSGSPLPFSFSEESHVKSVAVVELEADGTAAVEVVPTPIPRPLRTVTGTLEELLASDDPELPNAWVRAILTDDVAQANPMHRLRERWPHTVTIEWRPSVRPVSESEDIARLKKAETPIEVCEEFVKFVRGVPATPAEVAHLTAAIETAGHNPEVAR